MNFIDKELIKLDLASTAAAIIFRGALILFFLGMLYIILGTKIAYATDISACGTISGSGTYTQTLNLNSTGTCITISASNVVLDCAGYTINYSNTSTGYGITASAKNNITIKNCNINQTNSSVANSHAIYFSAVTNSTIFNSTANSILAFGIYIAGASTNNIINYSVGNSTSGEGIVVGGTNNTFLNTIGSGTYRGIDLFNSNNGTYVNVTAINTNITAGQGAFYLSNSSYNTITNSTALSTTSSAFQVTSSSLFNTFNFVNGTASATNNGLLLSSSNNTFINSYFLSGSRHAILITTSSNNVFNNVSGYGGPGYAGYSVGSSSGFNIINNSYGEGQTNGYGISFVTGSANNTVLNSAGYAPTGYGLYLNAVSNNNITNSTFTATGAGGRGIFVTASTNNSFNNISASSLLDNGIRIESSNSNLVMNSQITSATGVGMYLTGSSYNNITYMNVSSGGNDAFYITATSNNNNISYSNFTTSNSGSYGIHFSGANNNTFTYCIANYTLGTGSGGGIKSDAAAAYNSYNRIMNSIAYSNSTSSSSGGILISGSGQNYTTIYNSTGYAWAGYGISLGGSATTCHGIINYSTGYSNSLQGILIGSTLSCGNNSVYNSLGSSVSSYGIYAQTINNTVIYNSTGISSSSDGIRLSNSNNITINNSTGTSTTGSGLSLLSSMYNNISTSTFTGNSSLGAVRFYTQSNSSYFNYNNVNGMGNVCMETDTGPNILNTYQYNVFQNCSIAVNRSAMSEGASLSYNTIVNSVNGFVLRGNGTNNSFNNIIVSGTAINTSGNSSYFLNNSINPESYLIAGMEADEDWHNDSAFDTVNVKQGTRSLRLTFTGSWHSSNNYYYRVPISLVDYSNISFYIYASNANPAANVPIYLGTNGSVNFHYDIYTLTQGWNYFNIPRTSFSLNSVGGTPDWNAITYLQIASNDPAIYGYVSFDDLRVRGLTTTAATGILINATGNNNTFYHNNISATVFVNDTNGTNIYNTTGQGNIYYFANGSGAWTSYDIRNNGLNNWAWIGAQYPFSNTTIPTSWPNFGVDNWPFTLKGPLPAPVITQPNSSSAPYVFNSTVNINYTVSPLYNYTYFNISLYDSSLVFIKTIIANTSNLSYAWNSSGTAGGYYKVGVKQYDNIGQNIEGYSDQFQILNYATGTVTNMWTSTKLVGAMATYHADIQCNNGISSYTLYIDNDFGAYTYNASKSLAGSPLTYAMSEDHILPAYTNAIVKWYVEVACTDMTFNGTNQSFSTTIGQSLAGGGAGGGVSSMAIILGAIILFWVFLMTSKKG